MTLANTSRPLLDPTTEAREVVFSLYARDLPARLTAVGLVGEVVPLVTLEGPDGEYEGIPSKDGVAIQLSATDAVILLESPGAYKLDKPATASPTGFFITKASAG